MSLTPTGTEFASPPQNWLLCDLSGNGNAVVFAHRIVGECNNTFGIFRRDIGTGATTRIICRTKNSDAPRANFDGSAIAFEGFSTITNNHQIYLTASPFGASSLELVSEALGGGEADKFCTGATISGSGTRVAFASQATNLTPNAVVNNHRQIFLRDRAAGVTILVTANSAFTTANGASRHADLSNDGLHLAFASSSTDLLPAAASGFEQIFVYDVASGSLVLISKDTTGAQADQGCMSPSISGNGRYVAYHTRASNVAPGSSAGAKVVLHDRDADGNGVFDEPIPGGWTTRQISVDTLGLPTQVGGGSNPRISADGARVVYWATDTFNGPNPQNRFQVWLWDRDTEQTRNIHVDTAGNLANGHANPSQRLADVLAISDDGTRALFTSAASNLDLTLPDTNGFEDAFVHDICTNSAVNYGGWARHSAGTVAEYWVCGRPSIGPSVLRLRRAPPSTPVVIIWNATAVPTNLPLLCGTLIPDLAGLLSSSGAPLATDALGSLDVPLVFPIPPLATQFLFIDFGACSSFIVASNGLVTL